MRSQLPSPKVIAWSILHCSIVCRFNFTEKVPKSIKEDFIFLSIFWGLLPLPTLGMRLDSSTPNLEPPDPPPLLQPFEII